jgi:sigma-B regulation protein RsbU (phosphoserine phosphatase)
MKLSLRTKIMGMIVLVGALLLMLALSIIWTLGYRQQVAEQGATFRSEAGYVAGSIRHVIDTDISKLNDLIAVGDLARALEENRATRPAAEIEAEWSSLAETDPRVRSTLDNSVAAKLNAFRRVNPLVVELLAADTEGRLIAATGKASDYDQSDETWWQKAITLRSGEAVLEGLAIDQSAGVFSLDISLPILDPEGRPVGVLKAVINVAPHFSGLTVFTSEGGVTSEVVSEDGQVVLRLGDRNFVPSGKTLSQAVMQKMRASLPGWFFADWNGAGSKLVGVAPIEFLGVWNQSGRIEGATSFVVVHQPASAVLAPLLQRAWVLMAAGALIILLCGVLTMYLVGRNLLGPLEVLENAAAALTSTASRTPGGSRSGRPSDPEAALAAVAAIKTGDEIEEFAGNFGVMSGRLMRYQEDLRREIAEKTAAIQSDLDLAREFQQAFLPRNYPQIPTAEQGDPVTLNFQHVYQAAMSVSGDFFDIIKLDDSRAGVLIADVMGHGTRSALVTAILRTLLHGLSRAATDPAIFLSLLNRHFHDTMRQTDQLIFVSACFVVLDTREKTLQFASAGHPSPLLGNRGTGQVEPLHGPLRDNPALGLFPDSEYQDFCRPLREGDVLLLYTDGIIEAMNEEGLEFGRERLAIAMRKNLDMDLAGFTQATLESVQQFTGFQPPADDLCLVAVGASANGQMAAPHRKSPHESLLEL